MVGGEMMTSRLLEHLVAAGHDVTVLSMTIKQPYERNGVKVRPRRSNLQTAELNAADLIISHPEITHYLVNRVGSLGTAYIGIVHNLEEENVKQLHKQRPDLLIVNSEDTQAKVEALGVTHPTWIMYPPTPAAWVAPPASADLPRQFVTQINLAERKGGDVFWELAERFPKVPFLGVIGGYGDQILPNHRPSNVTLLGPSPDMGLIYALTKVLIQPSHTETYGMAGAEALVNGIPVISSAVEGIPSALAEGARYCDPDDPQAWADALDGLLYGSHAEWSRAVGAARNRGTLLNARSEEQLDEFVQRCVALSGTA